MSPSTDPTSQPTSSYQRERFTLSEYELETVGGLRKGDCTLSNTVKNPEVVDCSEPHSDQVMGFVDLSEGMPSFSDAMDFETAVARRCNSLKATMPIPEDFQKGLKANYPDQDEWDAGSRVALCWVPVFNKTWVGSALDGTATVI